MIRVGETGRTLHMQTVPGVNSPVDPLCGMMDNPEDAKLIAWLVNKWLKEEGHTHWFTLMSSPAGPWLQCPCGETQKLLEGQDFQIGPQGP